MFKFIGNILAYIFKNLGVIIGVLEAILKVLAGIVSITPTKRDDAILAFVDKVFSAIKKLLYGISDALAGKKPYTGD